MAGKHSSSSQSLVKFMILFILVICLYMVLETDYINDVKFVKAKVDNNTYLVRNTKDAPEAANLLAQMRIKLTEVVELLHKLYPADTRALRLKSRFKPFKISESTLSSQYTSYSVNKGEKIVFCLRSKDKNKDLHDFDTLTFVGLHELAHLMTESIGHTTEFWENFRFILKNCIEHKLYTYHDFRAKPVKYCGTDITDSPLH